MTNKEFKSYVGQLSLLNKRNLNIFPITDSYNTLKRINYYNLINGYNLSFLKSNTSDEYINGACFSEIYNLYNFDKKISSLYLSKVLEIESLIKSKLSYVFSESYGQMSDQYLIADNFETKSKKSLYNLNKYLVSLNKQIWDDKKAQPYITHYRNNHGFVPLWVLVNSMTFGNMNIFYRNMKNGDKIKISKELSTNVVLLESSLSTFLQVLNSFRNILAHDERFYNVRFKNKGNRNYKVSFNRYFKFSKYNTDEIFSSVFTLTLIIKILLPHKDFIIFISELFSLIDELKNNMFSIDITEILTDMNFLIPSKNINNLHDIKNILYSRP